MDVLQKLVSGGHNQAWINARYNVTKQMQVMQGKLTRDEIMTDPDTGLVAKGPLPRWLDADQLPKISKEKIAVRLICCLGNDYSSYGLGEAAYCPSSQLVPIFHLPLNGVPKLAAVFKLLKTAASFKNGLSQL